MIEETKFLLSLKVWEIQKKADNSSPLIGIDDFFKYEYYKRNQMKAKHQAKANLALINRLNMILRSTGKVDHYNIFAENRSSKLENEIPNLKNIDRENRELAKFLKQIVRLFLIVKNVFTIEILFHLSAETYYCS